MSAPLKAYLVSESSDGHACVVFAVSGAPARQAGASELGTDWDSIESCRRAPELDAYAPGPVPQRALFDAGWWFECGHCGHRVSQEEEHDGRQDAEGNDADPAEFGFFERGRRVYCCLGCMASEDAVQQDRKNREAAVIEAALLKWPEAMHASAHDTTKGWCAVVALPGLLGDVRWTPGDTHAWVERRDEAAFSKLYGPK